MDMKHAICAAVLFPFISSMICPALAQDATLVVLEARGVGLHPGETLDPEKPLVLKEGQHVTFVTASGGTLRLDGPYNKTPGAEIDRRGILPLTLEALLTQQQMRSGEAAISRGRPVPSNLPDPWLVDASRSGSACVLGGSDPIFWRGDTAKVAVVAVMPSDRSWKSEAQWPAGKDRIAVPTNVPMRGGMTYFVQYDHVESTIKLNALPAALKNDQMRASWMAQKGCEAQAEALLRPRQ